MWTCPERGVVVKGKCANHMKKNAAVHTDNTPLAEYEPHEAIRVLNMST